MKYTKEESAAFTGHRFVKYDKRQAVMQKIKDSVYRLHSKGTKNFICGMAMGFDLMAAEGVLAMKAVYSDIHLTAVVPFKGQDFAFTESEKRRYKDLLKRADEVIVLSEKYYKGCLLRRNDFMLEHSSTVIAYYDGGYKGGTFYTCRMAQKGGIPIINLY